MKLTFEADKFEDIVRSMKDLLDSLRDREGEIVTAKATVIVAAPQAVEDPFAPAEPEPAAAKPKAPAKPAKPAAPAPAKAAKPPPPKAAKPAPPKVKAPPPPPEPEEAEAEDLEEAEDIEEAETEVAEPEPDLGPAALAALRVQVMADLEEAYAKPQPYPDKVLALLKQYGNGAKAFRELTAEQFVPIRKAIDDGALA